MAKRSVENIVEESLRDDEPDRVKYNRNMKERIKEENNDQASGNSENPTQISSPEQIQLPDQDKPSEQNQMPEGDQPSDQIQLAHQDQSPSELAPLFEQIQLTDQNQPTAQDQSFEMTPLIVEDQSTDHNQSGDRPTVRFQLPDFIDRPSRQLQSRMQLLAEQDEIFETDRGNGGRWICILGLTGIFLYCLATAGGFTLYLVSRFQNKNSYLAKFFDG
ncbi:putative mediator of RNA polymerase II transcription subunit 29 [Chironomus tepperi]|uniref:putative mediator of RNA polymerase II transcription subunit 29 n=1 Tax=Chironomus tepperi TaxID=113505 RepID=UPI00391F8958